MTRSRVAGRSKVGDYTVTGVVRTDGGGLPAGSSLALFTTEEARALFDRALDDNAVGVRLADGADPAEVEGAIRRTLPPGIEVVDGATAAVHRQEGLTRSFTLVRSLILGFAGLALVVGMVTVANSLALLYGERRRTFASLRLVGAKPRQLMVAALVEAGMLAVLASLIGAPLGLLLGRLIEAALGALNTSVPVSGSVVSWSALGWAVLIGTVATLVAALFPAARACRVAPIEAVTEAEVDPPGRLRRNLLTVAAVAVVAGAGTAVILLREDVGTSPALAGALVAAGIAVIGLLPVVLSSLVSAGIRLVPLRPRALRRIAARDVVRNRTRTAATAAALILATAVVSGLAVFLSSFTASIDGEVDQLVTADLVVDSGTFTRGGLPADLLEQLGNQDGVDSASGWQVGRANVGFTPIRLTGIDTGALYDVLSPVWVGEPPASVDDSSVLLSQAAARDLGVGVGDLVPVTFTSGGTENLRLAGIYDSGSVLLGEAVVDRSVLLRQVPATTDIAGLVSLSEDTPAVRSGIEDLAASYGITAVLEPDQFVDTRSDLLRGFQRVIEWMLLFTLVQALVGVVNTLLLSVGERRREFGLLRASGASRRQVLRLVLFEGISLAVVGTAVGLVLGISGAWLALRALGSLGLDTFVIPVGSVILTGVAAAALGIVAAIIPARWAAAVPPLEAVADVGGLRIRARRTQRVRIRRLGRPAFHMEELPAGTPLPAAAPVLPVAGSTPLPPPLPAAMAAAVPGAPEPVPSPAPVAAVPAPPVVPVVAPVAAAAVAAAAVTSAAASAPSFFDQDADAPAVRPEAEVPLAPTASGALFGTPTAAPAATPPVAPPIAAPAAAAPAAPLFGEPLADEPLFGSVAPEEAPPVVPIAAGAGPATPLFGAATTAPGAPGVTPPGPVPAPGTPLFDTPAPAPAPAEPVAPAAPAAPVSAPEPAPLFAPPPVEPAATAAPFGEPAPVAPPASEPGPVFVPAPEPEPVVREPEPAAAVAPEPTVIAEPTVPPEPEVVLPEPEVAAGTPFAASPSPAARRKPRVTRLVSDTTRRRKDRSGTATPGVVEGWMAPEPESEVPAASATTAAPESRVSFQPGQVGDRPVGGLRFGPGAAATGAASGATTGSGGPGRGSGGPDGPTRGGGSGPGRSGSGDGGHDAPEDDAPEDNGLAAAAGRLSRESVRDGAAAFALLGGALAPGEHVDHVVQGWAWGMACVVARTERRVLVVVDRPGRPLVESLHPTRTTVSVFRPAGSASASLAVVDGRRVLEVAGVRDEDEAAAISRSGNAGPGYF